MALSQAVILALECSAGKASAALSHNGEVISQQSHVAPHGHAAWMVSLAKDVVDETGHRFDQLTHVVAGRGPGSFTGIRVALAAAKGLALSLNIGATGLSSLSGMAAQMHGDERCRGRYLMTCIDSRRGSYFYQAFSPDGTPISEIHDGDRDHIKSSIREKQGAWAIAGDAIEHGDDWGDDVIMTESDGPEAKGLLGHYHHVTDTALQHAKAFTDLDPLYLSAPLLGPR